MQLAGRVPREWDHVRIDKRRHGAVYGAKEVSQAAVEANMAVNKDIAMPTVVLETSSDTYSAVTMIPFQLTKLSTELIYRGILIIKKIS